MEYILQISTGGFYHQTADFENIRKRIDYCMLRIKVKALVIGWAVDPPLYSDVCDYLKDRCPVYLWLPVFSEIGDICKVDPHIGFMGGAAEPIGTAEGESFIFVCPSSPHNHQQIAKIYDRHFSGCGFDGVFLDKIRFAAFSNGYEGAFGCFCVHCRAFYENCGVDLGATFALLKEGSAECFLPKAFDNSRYAFWNPLIEALFTARAKLITVGVASVADRFRERGLKVALDTFAPSVSWFVGQDIPALASLADFIKPMLYRVTQEPAGIGYEFNHIIAKLGFGQPHLLRARLTETTGAADPCSDEFFTRQLSMLKTLGCPVAPGIEANRKAGCDSSPAYLRRSAELARESGCDAIVLAWDILSAPDEHIDCLV